VEQHITQSSGCFYMDEAGFDGFFRRFYPIAFSVAISITRNPVDAHDVVQSVFCKIWATRSTIGRKSAAIWLNIVTRNAAIDHVRRSMRECAYLASASARGRAAMTSPSAEEEALKNVECGELARAVEQLGNRSAKLLFESFIEEQSHRSIASTSSVPLGTVKARIRTSLRRVRQLMMPEQEHAIRSRRRLS
jgi:RNA polymerase sigma-70 factor (ECF subfamily)